MTDLMNPDLETFSASGWNSLSHVRCNRCGWTSQPIDAVLNRAGWREATSHDCTRSHCDGCNCPDGAR